MVASMRIPARKSKRVGTYPIGVPMQTPAVNAQEPVNLVGDSGKTYARMGEAGPEAISVEPLSRSGSAPGKTVAWKEPDHPNGEPLPVDASGRPTGDFISPAMMQRLPKWTGPARMALGGYAVVGGGGGYDPTSRAIQRNRRRRDQLSQVYGARRNVQDLQNVGMQRTLQGSQDYKYAAGGVATPANIDVPEGFQGQLSPLVRPTLRTQADRLQERFSEENAFADLDDQYASLTAQNQGGGYRVAPSPTQRGGDTAPGPDGTYSPVPFGTPEPATRGPAGHVKYTDPNGQTRWLRPGDAALQKARDQMALEEKFAKENAQPPTEEEVEKQQEARMKREGYVLYRDPVTRQSEWLSPFDAAVRKSADEDKLEAAVKKTPASKPYANTSPAALAKAMVNGALDFDEGYAALAARGFSREEIDLLVRMTKRDDDEGDGSAE